MPPPPIALILRLIAQHRVFDVFDDLGEGFGLVVMRVDIDDEEILVAPLDRLLRRRASSSVVVSNSSTERSRNDVLSMAPSLFESDLSLLEASPAAPRYGVGRTGRLRYFADAEFATAEGSSFSV